MTSVLDAPATTGSGATPVVAGLDLGLVDRRAADALLHAEVAHLAALGLSATPTLMTHRAVTGDGVHVALSLELGLAPDELWDLVSGSPLLAARESAGLWLAGRSSGPDALVDGARTAAAAGTLRTSGRAVCFPGVEALVGELTVGEVLGRSAIERVSVLAGGAAHPDQVLVTRDHVRPTCVDGRLELQAQPAVGGTLVPFEVATPTPCCADH